MRLHMPLQTNSQSTKKLEDSRKGKYVHEFELIREF